MVLALYNSKGFGRRKTAQQSVQPTGGILCRFQAFLWLRAFSCSPAESQPAHQRLTQTVGTPLAQQGKNRSSKQFAFSMVLSVKQDKEIFHER
jgi:hypothetical protein